MAFSNVYLTSSAVNGVPSCHVTFGRSLKRHASASDCPSSRASFGVILKSGPVKSMSGSRMCACICRPGFVKSASGSRLATSSSWSTVICSTGLRRGRRLGPRGAAARRARRRRRPWRSGSAGGTACARNRAWRCSSRRAVVLRNARQSIWRHGLVASVGHVGGEPGDRRPARHVSSSSHPRSSKARKMSSRWLHQIAAGSLAECWNTGTPSCLTTACR